jgi:hypothetical protein
VDEVDKWGRPWVGRDAESEIEGGETTATACTAAGLTRIKPVSRIWIAFISMRVNFWT